MAAWLEGELDGGPTCGVEVTAVVLFGGGNLRHLLRVRNGARVGVRVRVRGWIKVRARGRGQGQAQGSGSA